MMKKTIIVSVLSVLLADIAAAAAPNISGIVSVGAVADASHGRLGTGFAADGQGHVIARIKNTRKEVFVHTVDGMAHTATVVAYSGIGNLALLKVTEGAESLKPYHFARGPAEPQRKVYGIKVREELAQSQSVAGALAGVQRSNSGANPGYYLHNALVGKLGEGGPLFNNCGEVVGVIVPRPGFLKRMFKRLKRMFGNKNNAAPGYAVPIEWLIGRFDGPGLSARADEVCLSEAVQATKAAEESREAQTKLEEESREAQAKLEEEARRVAEATQEAATAQAELASLKRQLEEAEGASEEDRLRLQAEIDARQRIVDETRAQEAAAQMRHEAAQRAAEQREKRYLTWGGAIAGALVMLLLLVWALKHRAVTRERREKVEVQCQAEEVQAGLAAREREEARIRQTPAVFFEGADSAGQTVALRVPGASISISQGVIIGRNPADSDFVINHAEVSRRHFRLFVDGNALMIEDADSTNGTVVDGKKLNSGGKTALVDHSRVELGDLKLSARLEPQ